MSLGAQPLCHHTAEGHAATSPGERLRLLLAHPLLLASLVGSCSWFLLLLSLLQRLHYCLLYKLHNKHIRWICYFLYRWLHVAHHEEVDLRAGLLR